MKTYSERLSHLNPGPGQWRERHIEAFEHPIGFERAMVCMITGWLRYADLHFSRYEALLSDDAFLGPVWEQMGLNIRSLLNGECGRLDCGTLDHVLVEALEDHGFKVD
jgi:hypothetical protein